MKSRLRYVWVWLQKYDFLWSVGASFGFFWFVGYFLNNVLGLSIGTYDLGFIQPVFLAISVSITIVAAALFGLRFNFKNFYDWIYTKESWGAFQQFKNLTAWQQFVTVFIVFFSFVILIAKIYLTLV